jgi:YHS domain-containing protein
VMTIEVLVRGGVLDTAAKQDLAHRLLTEVIAEESAPESVMAGVRALTNVLIHEPDVWVTGGAEPRYLVRVTVPGSWHTRELAKHLVPKITELVAATEPDQDRLTREPHCQVQIIGLKEHGVGTLGRPVSATDITRLMTDGYRGERPEATPGTDPVCGMAVDLATATITLDHDGTRYAFCAPVCRKVFAEELGVR